MRDYQTWDDRSAFVGAWLFSPKSGVEKIRFSSHDGDGDRYGDAALTVGYNESVVATIVHYERHEARVLAGKHECNRYNSTRYVCTGWNYEGGAKQMEKSYIDPYMVDRASVMFKVWDQYGNGGKFYLEYPNRSDDLVLR